MDEENVKVESTICSHTTEKVSQLADNNIINQSMQSDILETSLTLTTAARLSSTSSASDCQENFNDDVNVEDVRYESFIERALQESRRMEKEISKSAGKRDSVRTQVGIKNMANWTTEHANLLHVTEQHD
eukprot:m.114027 g.114027  ORF g.114027 m.114027 type:complete len:130 (-) comp17115_c0_seq2:1675-2064(-)